MILTWILAVLALIGVGCHGQFVDDSVPPVVTTPLGKIRGAYDFTYHGHRYETYKGIPYALPPVGKLRFKPPHPILAWPGELVANKYASDCIQFDHIPKNPLDRVVGSEDCLYLNVHVPIQSDGVKTEKMPVFFWIHGGAFQFGSGSYMGPRYLLDRDVILVTMNYRLGPLGFLSTEDEIVPGNMGLKDQNMALRWVSENIEAFGGDPKNIVIGGISAGGASTHYHYLSPLSAGLFQGGMSFSGTALLCWAQTENALEKTKRLADLMGCPTEHNKEMIRCLRYRPVRALVQSVGEYMPWLYNPYTPFGPIVEKAGPAPFINSSPAEIISSGKAHDVPWMTTVVTEEGLYPAAEFVAKEERLKELDENWVTIAPHLLDFNYTIPHKQHAEVANKIREHYFKTNKIDKSTVGPLVQMIGDRLFVVDSEKAARMQAKANKSPVYYYYFGYRAKQSLSDAMSYTTENFGVSHGDDAYMVFDTPYLDPTSTKEDVKMLNELIDIWFSFITDKKPKAGVEWPKLDPLKKEMQYLYIAGPGKYSMKSNENFGQKKFWNTIDFNENKLGGKKIKEEL